MDHQGSPLSSRFELAEEMVNLKIDQIEIIQPEEQREKRMKKNKQSLREI